jgi:hypothetical protein
MGLLSGLGEQRLVCSCFRFTFACRYQVILIVFDNRREIQVSDWTGVTVTGQWYNLGGIYSNQQMHRK